MSYGFLATNNNSQVLVSSDTSNLHFIGKATYNSTLQSIDTYGGLRQWIYRFNSNINVTPLPFFTMPVEAHYGISAIRHADTSYSRILRSAPISVIGTPIKTFTWGAKDTALLEGTTYSFNINTTNVPDGTTLYWDINSSTNDFTAIDGNFTVSGSTGYFQVSPTKYYDPLTETTETFTVNVRTYTPLTGSIVLSTTFTVLNNPSTDITGFGWSTDASWGSNAVSESATATNFWVSSTNANNTVIATSPTYTLSASSSAAMIAVTRSEPVWGVSKPITTEGTTLTINVTTTNISDGTTLYWNITSLGTGQELYTSGVPNTEATTNDFVSRSGSVLINNNAGSFTITSLAIGDVAKEMTYEDFQLALYKYSSFESYRILLNTLNFAVYDNSGNFVGTTPTYINGSLDMVPRFGSPELNSGIGQSNMSEGVATNVISVYNGVNYFWTINHITTTTADFAAVSGKITSQYLTSKAAGGGGTYFNTGYFYVNPVTDTIFEGTEIFTISIRSGSITGPIVVTSGELRVLDLTARPLVTTGLVKPAIVSSTAYSNNGFITNGATISCTLYLPSAPGTITTYYWRIKHITTSKDDFVSDSGSIVFPASSATNSFNIVTSANTASEVDETFAIEYISAAAANYMYWDITNITTTDADFIAVSGVCIPTTTLPTAWTFSIRSLLDTLTEGTERFKVNIRRGSPTGTVEVTSSEIRIADISLGGTYMNTPTSITEGSNNTVTVYTPTLTNGTKLYWDIEHITTTDLDFSSVIGSFSSSTTGANIIINAINDASELDENFRVNIQTLPKNLWEVEIIRSGTSATIPEVYMFADTRATIIPPTETMGLVVYKDDGSISFDSRRGPLNLADSVPITFPSGPVNTLPTYLNTDSDWNFSTPGYLNGHFGISMTDGNASALFTPTKETIVTISSSIPNKPIYFVQSLAQTELEVFARQTFTYSSGLFGINSTHLWWDSVYWAFYRGGVRRSGNSLYAGWITIDKGVSVATPGETTDKLFGAWNSSQQAQWTYQNPISNETLNRTGNIVLISDGNMYD